MKRLTQIKIFQAPCGFEENSERKELGAKCPGACFKLERGKRKKAIMERKIT